MRCICALLVIALVSACGGSGGGSNDGGSQISNASLRIWITDAPFPYEFVESASVVIREVRVRDGEQGPWQTVFTGESEFDLVPLTNGVEALLVDASVPPGTYDEVRMIVEAGEVVLSPEAIAEDGIHEYSTENGRLHFPSGGQTGLKVKIDDPIVVTSAIGADLVLDFDLAKNFVFNGPVTHAPGVKRVLFKPVIRATNATTAGSIALTVLSDNQTPGDPGDDVPRAGATVRILDGDGNEVATQSTGGDGRAAVSAPPGTYDVQVEASGHVSTTLPAVQVTLGNMTELGNVVLEATLGEIAGVVMSDGGTPAEPLDDVVIAGATVELRATGVAGPALATTTTDANGAWRFEALAAGGYDIAVTAEGFSPGSLTNVAAGPPGTGHTILLAPLAQDLSGTVTVPLGVDVTTISIVVRNGAGVIVATAAPAADGMYVIPLRTGAYEVTFDDGLAPQIFELTLIGADPLPAPHDLDVVFE